MAPLSTPISNRSERIALVPFLATLYKDNPACAKNENNRI